MRTPLGRVLGHGSAQEGSGHWWSQRVSAVALVPLLLWLVISIVSLTGMDHAGVTAWVRQPLNAVLLVLLLGTLFYHSWLGVQVVIEDYIHLAWLKLVMLLLVKFAHVLLAAFGIFIVLRLALGSGA